MAETTALQAKMKFDTAEVTQARTLKKGYKVTGISGSGTVKLNKVTSYWLKRAAQAIKEGKAIRGTIISNLDDPEVFCIMPVQNRRSSWKRHICLWPG